MVDTEEIYFTKQEKVRLGDAAWNIFSLGIDVFCSDIIATFLWLI